MWPFDDDKPKKDKLKKKIEERRKKANAGDYGTEIKKTANSISSRRKAEMDILKTL